MTTKERYTRVIEYFSKTMPTAESELNYRTPFELLVAVVLSAQCTDKRVNMTTPALFERYPTPFEMAEASEEDIFQYIKSISYPNNKAKHLATLSRQLVEKFGGEVTFIKPHWYNEEFPACLTWIESLKRSEKEYLDLREMGLKPQDARDVLPNATKTEVVVTGFESDWEHFFSLRSPKYGAQGVHPDMAKLADELYEKLNSVNK